MRTRVPLHVRSLLVGLGAPKGRSYVAVVAAHSPSELIECLEPNQRPPARARGSVENPLVFPDAATFVDVAGTS